MVFFLFTKTEFLKIIWVTLKKSFRDVFLPQILPFNLTLILAVLVAIFKITYNYLWPNLSNYFLFLLNSDFVFSANVWRCCS